MVGAERDEGHVGAAEADRREPRHRDFSEEGVSPLGHAVRHGKRPVDGRGAVRGRRKWYALAGPKSSDHVTNTLREGREESFMDPSEQVALIKRYVAAYNAFDIDGMIASVHEEVAFRNISDGVVTHETRGVAAFRAQAAEGARIFSSREQTITGVSPLADDGEPGMAVEIDYRAVLASDLPNGMKAGDTIELTGRSEFRFRDGRIVSIVDRI
jgi:ketosteroid isomerase-like protein